MPEDLYELPASPGQEQMHLIHQMHRGRTPYHIAGGMRLRGELDAGALQRAITALADRHEVLRTVLRLDRTGETRQVIRSGSGVELPVVEAFDHDADEVARHEFALRRLSEFALRPFDLANGPVLRTTLLRLGHDDHLLAVVIHHIAADGWSLGVLMEDLGELYRAIRADRAPDLPELPLQYADFAVWQREVLASGALDAQREFWRNRLADAHGFELPPAEDAAGDEQVEIPLRWDGPRLAALTEVCRAQGATTFMVLLTGFAIALSRWSGRTDLVVATPIAGRGQSQLDRVVGYFVNTLALRVDLDGDPTFTELLRRTRQSCLSSYANQDVPYDQVLADVSPPRGRPRSPLAPVLFALANAPRPSDDQLPGIKVERVELPANTGGFDLAVNISEQHGELRGHLIVAAGKYSADTVRRIADDWMSALAWGISDGDRPLSTMLPLPAVSS